MAAKTKRWRVGDACMLLDATRPVVIRAIVGTRVRVSMLDIVSVDITAKALDVSGSYPISDLRPVPVRILKALERGLSEHIPRLRRIQAGVRRALKAAN